MQERRDAQQRQREDGDLLVSNPNHARNAWRPLKPGKDGLEANGEEGTDEDDGEGEYAEGREEYSDYDDEDGNSDSTPAENRKVDKFGNYIEDEDSVETVEQGAANLAIT